MPRNGQRVDAIHNTNNISEKPPPISSKSSCDSLAATPIPLNLSLEFPQVQPIPRSYLLPLNHNTTQFRIPSHIFLYSVQQRLQNPPPSQEVGVGRNNAANTLKSVSFLSHQLCHLGWGETRMRCHLQRRQSPFLDALAPR